MPYASLRLRLAAFVFDYILISLYIVVLSVFSVLLLTGPLSQVNPAFLENPLFRDFLAFVTLVMPVMLYFALWESSPSQATWGKRRMGLKVVNTDGYRLSLPRALVRAVIKLAPWQLSHTLLFQIEGWPSASAASPLITTGFVLVWILIVFYFISVPTSKRHQSPYDRLAGSLVLVLPQSRSQERS